MRGDRPAGQDRDAVLATLIVETLSERHLEAREPGKLGGVVYSGRTRRAAIDFLEQDDVRGRAPNYARDPFEIVDSTSVLPRVNVVDEDIDERITSTGTWTGTRGGARDEENERASARDQS